MIATKEPTKNPKNSVIHVEWVQKQTLLCKVGKEYGWGFGLSPIRQYDELFPEGAKMLRVNAQNAKRFESELVTGESWIVSSIGYHFKEGDMVKGCLVVHVEGRLLRKATEAEVKSEKLLAELADEERLLEKLPDRKRSENKRYALEIPAQDTVWTVGKLLKWKDREGNDVFGYKLERKDEVIFADVLPEKQKVFRLEAKSVPVKTGQRWNVSVNSLHYAEDDVDPKGNAVVYVEGELVSEAKKEMAFVPKQINRRPYPSKKIATAQEPDDFLLPEKERRQVKVNYERDFFEESKWSSKFNKLDFKKKKRNVAIEDDE